MKVVVSQFKTIKDRARRGIDVSMGKKGDVNSLIEYSKDRVLRISDELMMEGEDVVEMEDEEFDMEKELDLSMEMVNLMEKFTEFIEDKDNIYQVAVGDFSSMMDLFIRLVLFPMIRFGNELGITIVVSDLEGKEMSLGVDRFYSIGKDGESP